MRAHPVHSAVMHRTCNTCLKHSRVRCLLGSHPLPVEPNRLTNVLTVRVQLLQVLEGCCHNVQLRLQLLRKQHADAELTGGC